MRQDVVAGPTRPTRAARILRGALVVLLVLSMVAARVVWSSRIEYLEAGARLSRGDVSGAVDLYGRAARLYAPGNPWSARGFDRLAALGRAADDSGDRPAALSAFREVRSAALATRSFYTPHRALLDEANARIAVLSAALESPSVDPGRSELERARWYAERLAEDQAPSVLLSILALLGFGLWMGAALLFVVRGLDEEERIVPRVAVAAGLGVALGFALFVVGLARA